MIKSSESPKRKNNADKNRRRVLFLLSLLIVVCAVTLLWLSTSQPKNDLPTARLMYLGERQFISLNLQTGEQAELPFFSHSDRKLSPDGKWSASWTGDNDSSLELRATERDLEDRTLGIYDSDHRSISWSPDSQWIAFSAEPRMDNHYSNAAGDQMRPLEEIYLINIDTSETKRLTENRFTDRDPAISPDGTKIVYTSNADSMNRLYILDITTLESHILTRAQDGYNPTWSPDGRWIAFISNCQPGPGQVCSEGDLWIIRADGTGAQSVKLGVGSVEAIWLP